MILMGGVGESASRRRTWFSTTSPTRLTGGSFVSIYGHGFFGYRPHLAGTTYHEECEASSCDCINRRAAFAGGHILCR